MDEHPKLRLREQLRTVIRTLRYSHRTEQAYWHWIRNYIRFHQLRHPLEMAERALRESDLVSYPPERCRLSRGGNGGH